MSVDCFLDTNVLVYAAAPDDGGQTKCDRSLELIETEAFGVSSQVLQEFFVTVVRKIERPLGPELAIEWIEQLEIFPCAVIDAALVKVAIETSLRFQISYWDAAIIAAADLMGPKTLYSEDLSHGQLYGRVQVLNPYL